MPRGKAPRTAAGRSGARKTTTRSRTTEAKPARAAAPPSPSGGAQTDPAVDAFLSKLDHPRKAEIEAVRQIILGVSPQIREGLKWNAQSFRTTDYFATVNLRGRGGDERVWLILHRGAKAKDNSANDLKVADPGGLLKWLASDRCLVTFEDARDIQSKRAALQAILQAWIRQLPA